MKELWMDAIDLILNDRCLNDEEKVKGIYAIRMLMIVFDKMEG